MTRKTKPTNWSKTTLLRATINLCKCVEAYKGSTDSLRLAAETVRLEARKHIKKAP